MTNSLFHYEFDAFQRYKALKDIVDAFETSPVFQGIEKPSILDVGSGNTTFTREFLGDRYAITRSDTEALNEPDIVRLVPGAPLPFADRSFDIVMSMDVLEHVPTDQRPLFLAEMARVSRHACVVACPNGIPEVDEAEKRFAGLHHALFGPHRFMDEHREYGLPTPQSVLDALRREGLEVSTVDNIPLPLWENCIFADLLSYGDEDAKPATTMLHELQNSRQPTISGDGGQVRSEPYRKFFVAAREPGLLETLERSTNSHPPAPHRIVPKALAELLDSNAGYAGLITVELLKEWKRKHASWSEAAAHVQALEGALAEKDAHIQGLHAYATEKDQRIVELHGVLDQKDAVIEQEKGVNEEHGRTINERNSTIAGLEHAIQALKADLAVKDEMIANTRIRQRIGELIKALTHRVEHSSVNRAAVRVWRRLVPAYVLRRLLAGRAVLLQRLGRRLGRAQGAAALPDPYFDPSFYLEANPDVAESGMEPLAHYLAHGWREGRRPNPHFDPSFYLEASPDVAESGMEPLAHYLAHGWREGRRPTPRFDPSCYLKANPDVAESGMEPLAHYLAHGLQEGRRTGLEHEAVMEATTNGTMDSTPEASAAYVPPVGLLPWFSPLTLRTDPSLAGRPHLNVLVPGLAMKHMSGGPNTAINLAYRLAALGVSVRFIATDAPIDADPAPFWRHVRLISGVDRVLPNATLVDASDRTKTLPIGINDVFMATAWWTAQMAKYAVAKTNHRRFVYLIQDYEPILHPASTQSALAEETYALDHIPVINTSLLKEFLAERKIGRHADPAFSERAIAFEPAVDQTRFHAVETVGRRRTLLFYARPTNGLRNLFEMGVAALQKAIHDGVFDPAEWDFVGMGEAFAPVPLAAGAWLKPAPWLDFDGYARQMRESDILLSLMLSPHPSYPPIEMALCGKPVVTTVFANKTVDRLAELSPNIIGAEATIEGIAGGLAEARHRLDSGTCRCGAHGLYPGDWDTSFATAVPHLYEELLSLFGAPPLPAEARLGQGQGQGLAGGLFPGYRAWPADRYALWRLTSLRERAPLYADPEPGLLSFLTTVWNTDPRYVAELAESVFAQDGGTGFEWIILDNGSVREDTMALLAELGRHSCVRLHRVEQNLGIIGGMRYCLEHARNRYIVPLDSDDLLTPDCVRVVTTALKAAGYPALAYTDEDKILGDTFRDPYCKPDWDPVLFASSCYIAHLCCIDRERALELDVYGDPATEGSHDWDSFTRFHRAGHTPLHIAEVLYTWRMHESSTAGNINSKTYIHTSQRAVLEKFLGDRAGRCTVEPSPLFDGTPDWVFKRTREAPQPLTTVILHAAGAAPDSVRAPVLDTAIPHEVLRLAPEATPADLLEVARSCAARGALVHLLWDGVEADGDEWPWEAMACFELFPDTVVVGGRILQGDTVVAAGAYLGFGRGCDTPDAGRHRRDPGYFAQMFKMHSVNAVPVQHCVVSPAFLADVLPGLVRAGVGFTHLGAWLGAAARARNSRVVYSPLFLGQIQGTETQGTAARLDDLVPEAERVAFRLAHADRLPERALLSPHLGLTPDTAYQPLSRAERRLQEAAARAPGAASYAQEAEAAPIARLARDPLPARPPSVSILTIVYERTPLDCFRKLAHALFGQTTPFAEWVLLRNGPVPADLDAVLAELAADPRVRLLDSERNLGIIRGLRRCLEAAGGDWVLPVDGDDLLVRDALQRIALRIEQGAADRNPPTFVYSDEDIIRGSAVEAPFRRPDFDPILNTADSYIWHACAFRRDKAMDLDVYGDPEAEYCQDWDTVVRFAMAGEPIAHIPEVLYGWRHHLQSFSNSGTANDGSRRSAERVMGKVIAAQTKPELYEIAPFPIFRGLEQSAILRRPVSPLPLDAILLVQDTAEVDAGACFGTEPAGLCRTVHGVPDAGAPCSLSRLAAALARTSAGHVLVLRAELRVEDAAGLWEAMRLFEMHPDVALVGGRVLHGGPEQGERILDGCTFAGPGHPAPAPWLGLDRNAPGPFAMALKPQSAAAVPSGFFLVETAFLRDALKDAAPPELRAVGLGGFLGEAAWKRGRRVAYSPLVEARTKW
ncbi:rhamnosyltransferase WsaF family glycosyltransferase [Azospirillum argentinense]